jgi:hypothetical protein
VSKCIIKFLIIFSGLTCFAKIGLIHSIKSTLEQVGIPITKTYSIRASSIVEINLKISPGTILTDVVIELNNGRSMKLDIRKVQNKEGGKWTLEKVDIKMLTFTARAKSVERSNIEFTLTQ